MEWLFPIFALCVSTVANALNPGVRIQLDQAGLNYIESIGATVLDKHITEVKIPDISGSESILKYELSNFRIASFSASNSNTAISLRPPSSIVLSAHDVSASVNAHYKITVGSGWFSVTKSGDLTVDASGVSLSQSLAASQSGGKPHVTAGQCSASIGNLKITFHGDVIDSILNLFDSIIASYVKGKLNDILCSQAKSLINTEANQELNKFPTSISLGSGFNIDYSLTANPSVQGNNENGFAILPFRGEIWYTGHHDDPAIPQALPMSPTTGTAKMACMQISPIGLIGSLGYSAQIVGILHFDLTKSVLQQLGVGKYMACNCSSQCIGAFIPQIRTKCPSGGSVEVDMRSTDAPSAMSNTSGIFLSFGGDLDFKGDLPNGQVVELFTAHITMGAVIPSPLTHSGWTIKGQLHVTGATLTIKSSNVGTLDQAGLEQIWQLAIVSIVEGKLNGLAQAGIPLPNLPDFNVLSPDIQIGNHQITACANLQYTGPTYK